MRRARFAAPLAAPLADARRRAQVFDDFNKLSAEDGTPQIGGATFETLTGACAVVDALGPAVRKEMIAWFSNWQFAPYKHTFQPYGECGSLEKTELRYAWYRKCLQAYDETFAPLFPPSWHAAAATALGAARTPPTPPASDAPPSLSPPPQARLARRDP